jgi:hypothetical protein
LASSMRRSSMARLVGIPLHTILHIIMCGVNGEET